MNDINILIKPVSKTCNINCNYCFYHDVSQKRNKSSYGFMNNAILELIVKKALKVAKTSCTFVFQGGEPTLIGLDFYKKLIEYEKLYNINNVKVFHSIQTNGTLIDRKWIEFFSENQFLVGVSLDGYKEIHDKNRLTCEGYGTFIQVMNNIKLLESGNIPINVLSVVTKDMGYKGKKIYRFFREQGFRYLQFMPYIPPLYENVKDVDYLLSAKLYTRFIKDIFDEYYLDFEKGNTTSIRFFDDLVTIIMGYTAQTCGMNGRCSCQFIIESDGGVYPCDFYAIDKWKLGNIKEQELKELYETDTCNNFISSSLQIDNLCKQCKWFRLCMGGCRRYRQGHNDISFIKNYYCDSYKEFFDYSISRLIKIAEVLLSRLK